MTAAVPYVLFQVAALLGAVGQSLYKVAADRKRAVASGHLAPMVGGVLIYCGALLLFVLAFRSGGRLGVLYATYSSTFVWSLVIGRIWFDEMVTMQKVCGVLLIALGVCCVTLL